MPNRNRAPGAPNAFSKDEFNQQFLRTICWVLIFGISGFMIAHYTHFLSFLKKDVLLKKNSVRFSILCGIIFIICVVYLLLTTSHEGDRAVNMQMEHPIAAYTMTAMLLMLAITSFLIFVDIIGPLGIFFFFCFWGFLFNIIFIYPMAVTWMKEKK